MRRKVQFTQVIPQGCGMDIHKEVVFATVSDGQEAETREFKTFTSSLKQMREWLVSLGVQYVAMESTGVYWKPIYNVLEGFIDHIWIVNARHIKNVPGHKTDVLDSIWITQLLLAGLLKPSFIPSAKQRELRDLTRYRRKLIESRSANKNRIIRVMEDGNIKLSSVLTDTNGKTAQALIKMICDEEEITVDKIEDIRHKHCHHSAEEMYEACTGYMTEHKIMLLQKIRHANQLLTAQIDDITRIIQTYLVPYENTVKMLSEIPGIDKRICEELIAEIGLDMSAFPTSDSLCSWAGMCPGNNETGGKKKSGRTTHGNKHVRSALVEAAWAGSRTKDTFFQERFTRLAPRKGSKRALIAVGHSILIAYYNVLSTGLPYKELGSEHYPTKSKEKKTKYLLKELASMGYTVELKEE